MITCGCHWKGGINLGKAFPLRVGQFLGGVGNHRNSGVNTQGGQLGSEHRSSERASADVEATPRILDLLVLF